MLDLHQKKLDTLMKNLVIIKRFENGMSNYTYLCEDFFSQNKFVFRHPTPTSNLFVDFKNELNNIKIIEPLKINSQVIYQDEFGFKISEYIAGKNIFDNIDYIKVSLTLKKLHNADFNFLNNYDHLNKLNYYEKLRKNKPQTKYFELKIKFTSFYPTLKPYIKYPCHNDSQIANFIHSDNDKYYLLDWEFSAVNDYIYDIACFGNKDFENAEQLLELYSEDPKKNHYFRLYSWRMFQCLQWHNVAYHKYELGLSTELKIDFKFVSKYYLELAETMYLKAILFI